DNTPISLLIGGDDFIHVQSYELRLQNHYPIKETYETDRGTVTKNYSYKYGRLIDVVYQCADKTCQTASLKKRFEYHHAYPSNKPFTPASINAPLTLYTGRVEFKEYGLAVTVPSGGVGFGNLQGGPEDGMVFRLDLQGNEDVRLWSGFAD